MWLNRSCKYEIIRYRTQILANYILLIIFTYYIILLYVKEESKLQLSNLTTG